MPQSYKWISSNDGSLKSSNAQLKQLIVHDVKHVFNSISKQNCNLISIFGRARQGKSFLMNCLAGEKEIFRISNEKESCTQGIDISDKWIDLPTFESIDNNVGSRKINSYMKVGFIDAEGQGDKDVSYDANLVCPILLISKCVIFNWKGDLQKDHLLGTLGIMSRAAKNVNSIEKSKKFGHLHIVFRDWQATETDRNKVYESLFNLEAPSVESAVRNQIRKDVLDSFESIQVWLFDAPMESTKDLKKKLSYESTSLIFKSQLRSLRNSLTNQLKDPTYFSGLPLNGQSMLTVIYQVVQSLNKGESVMPSSIYVSMMKEELRIICQNFDNEVSAYASNQSQIFDKYVSSNTFFPFEMDVIKDAEISIDVIAKKYLNEVGNTVGDESLSPLYSEITKDLPSIISNTKSRAMSHIIIVYKEKLSRWLANAQKRLLPELLNEFKKIESNLPMKIDNLKERCESIFQNVINPLLNYDHPSTTKVIEDLSVEYKSFEMNILNLNNNLLSNVSDTINDGISKMKKSIDDTFSKMASHVVKDRVGFPIEVVEKALNAEYINIKEVIQKELVKRGLSTEKLDEALSDFRKQCGNLRETMVARYNDLLQKSYWTQLEVVSREIDIEINDIISQLEKFENLEELFQEITELFEDARISLLETIADWTRSIDLENQLLQALEQKKVLCSDELQLQFLKMEQEKQNNNVEMEIDDNTSSSSTNTTTPSRRLGNEKEQQEKARLYAISKGWIQDSTNKRAKKGFSVVKKSSKPRKTEEHLTLARKRAKDWANSLGLNNSTFGSPMKYNGNVDENKYPSNHSNFSNVKEKKSNDVLAGAKAAAKKEIEDRMNAKVSNIKSKEKK